MRRLFSWQSLFLEAVLGSVPTFLLLFLCDGNYTEFKSKLSDFILSHPLQYWFVLIWIFAFLIAVLNIKLQFSRALISFCHDLISAFVGILQTLNGIVLFVVLLGVWHQAFDIHFIILIVFYLAAHATAVLLSKFVDAERMLNAKMI
jgi:hypothetical protein